MNKKLKYRGFEAAFSRLEYRLPFMRESHTAFTIEHYSADKHTETLKKELIQEQRLTTVAEKPTNMTEMVDDGFEVVMSKADKRKQQKKTETVRDETHGQKKNNKQQYRSKPRRGG